MVMLVMVASLESVLLAAGDSCQANLRELTYNNRFPYLASIRQPGSRSHVCSGTLITKQYILTAAHCVDQTSVYSAGRKPIVHIGPREIDDVDDDVEVTLVADSFIHPQWDKSQRSPYNAALLKLNKPSEKQHPVVLSNHFRVLTGQELTAAGWGAGGESISVGSNIFGSAKLESQEYMQWRHCNRETLWNSSIPEGLSCALNHKQRASCLVDSGSPLLMVDQPGYKLDAGKPNLDFVIGVNIDGAPCGEKNKPDIYLNMSHLHSWIEGTAFSDEE